MHSSSLYSIVRDFSVGYAVNWLMK